MSNNLYKFSFVIPAFNEEGSIVELTDRIIQMMVKNYPSSIYEIILVDDGSTDSTWSIFLDLASKNSSLRGIKMRKNFGKSLALMSGLSYASGDLIVTLDADLQDNPEEVPLLLQKLNLGYDLVTGWRQARQDSRTRKFGSKCVNSFTKFVTGLNINDLNCGFKIMKKNLAKNLYIYGQFHRFIPLQAHLIGYRVSEEKVSNSARKYGISKYRTFRYHGMFDLMSLLFTFRFAHSPLHFFGKISFLFIIPALTVLIYLTGLQALYWFGLGESFMVYNRPLLSFALTSFTTGLVILLTGFICDFFLHHYSRTHLETIIKLAIDESTPIEEIDK